jgi:hypothetical protein
MTDEILSQMAAAFYQWTSLQVGDFNLADFVLNFQDALLHSTFVHILEIISAVATALLAYGAFRLASQQKELNKKIVAQTVGAAPQAAGRIQDQWNDVLRHIESPREGEWKFAIIEADKIVDDVLKSRFPGDTMGERLMNIDKTKLLSIDGLWEAHKLRNRLAHEPNAFIRHAEALRAIRLYETTLRELGVIQ